MPHASLKLIPGVDQNRTETLNEAAIWKCNLIRFMPDRQGQALPQKLGGWTKFINSTSITAPIRALNVWSDNNDHRYLGIGAENALFASSEALSPLNISPQYYTANIATSASTTIGSNVVTINDTGSNVTSYDSIFIETPISVGGVVLFGFYSCVNAAFSANSYTVNAANIIGVPTKATNIVPVTTISVAGAGPYTVTVNHPSGTTVAIGATVTFTGAGSYAGPYTVLTSASGTFTFSTATNLGSAASGTFTASSISGGAVPVFTPTSGKLTVAVTLADHGYSVGSTFPVLVQTAVGAATVSGNYLVTSILSSSQFTIAVNVDPASSTPVTMNNGNARIIYYIGQNVVPPSGYGIGGYGLGGYGIGVASANGRQYTGVTITTASGICTATLTGINVRVAPQSNIVINPGTGNQNYTVLTGTAGTNSTFTFAGTLSGTYTVTVSQWGFVMPDTLSAETTIDWSLDNWGEYLIANPHGGEVFYWNPAEQNHAVVVPSAPLVNEGAFVAMPERQVIAYGSTFTGVQDPLLVRWCDIADFTDWVATAVNQAGSFRIPKGSKIMGGMQGPQQGLLWTDIGLWAMQYVNQPLIYSFNEVASGCGLVGRKAMGVLGGVTYWMSQSQFFSLSGGGVQAIQCPIWDIVFQNIDQTYWENVRCAPNSRFNEISWFFPTIGSGGVPNLYVKYNATLNQWDYGNLTRTAWIDQSVFGPPIGAGSDLDIYQHETSNNADNEVMDAWFQTGYFAIQDGDLQTFLDQVWPDMKWGVGTSTSAIMKITFFAANYPGDTPRTYVFDNVTINTQYLTPRLRGRLVSIKVESNTLDTFWRLGGIRYRFQPDGKF